MHKNPFPTFYQEFIYKSRYARWDDEKGRRENWDETINRYLDFFDKKISTEYPQAYEDFKAIRPELFSAIYNLEVMPSMRALMTAGKAAERDNLAFFNCAYTPIDNPRCFDEILYCLTVGTGVGFSVERQYISKLPVVAEEFYDTDTTIVVHDSRIGWAKAFRELLSLLWAGQVPSIDYSKLRPAGARLKTFGGRSSGPGPLKDLFEFCIRIFKSAAGRRLTSLEVHDIVCKVGEVVVSGGVRRCLPIDTFVHTNTGLKRIQDVIVDDLVLSQNGVYKKVISTSNTGLRNLVSINTEVGVLQCTPEHRMAVLSNTDGSVVWVEAKNLTTEDKLVYTRYAISGSNTKLPSFSYTRPECSTTCKDITIPDLDSDMAWFLGNFHGDGYVALSNRDTSDFCGYVSMACSNNYPEQHERAVKQLSRFGITVSERKNTGEGCSKPRVTSHQLAIYLSQFKKPNTSMDIPPCILQGSNEVRASYIAGIFDADGSAKTSPIVVASSIYPQYLDQLRVLISSLGIASYIKKNRNSTGNWKTLYRLCIKGQYHRRLFKDIVGPFSIKTKDIKDITKESNSYTFGKKLFRSSNDRKLFHAVFSSKNPKIKLSMFHYESVVGQKNYLPIAVNSIDQTQVEKECFDLQIEDTECFYANGFLTHNSALLSMSNLSDDRMRGAKNGQWWVDNGQRALANNSAVYEDKPEFSVFMKEWYSLYESKAGERGIISRKAAIKKAESTGRRSACNDWGFNPCVEAQLKPSGLCNLSEIVVRSEDTEEDLSRKARIAAIFGTLQSAVTDFRYVRKIWKDTAEEERLLGVSLTGILDRQDLCTDTKFLKELKSIVIKTNQQWSDKLKINRSVATTVVKPSGTVSQLVDTASGLHPRFSEYYIRRVRIDKKDPLGLFMLSKGFPCEDDVTNPSVMVFSFPMKSPEGAKLVKDVTAMEQIKIWSNLQEHWCEHSASCTVYYKDSEFLEVGNWVYNNIDRITGISFLPVSDHIYRQAPYESITKEKYEELLKEIPQGVSWEELSEFEKEEGNTGVRDLACTGGACEIVDIVATA